jgi:hypothetical protein
MLLRCESLEPPMSQMGHQRPVGKPAAFAPCPLRPKSGHSAKASVYEYTPFCNGPGDVKSPRVIVTPPSSRFCPWSDAEAATLCCQGYGGHDMHPLQDYSYARLHKNEKKLISANITIRPSLDDSYYQYNLMQYFSEQKDDLFYQPSSIYFSAFIAPTAFRELIDNVRGRLFPEKILIELPSKSKRCFAPTLQRAS